MQRLPLGIIVAMAANRVIGDSGQIPWRIPTDLRHFVALTMGKPVVMGRKTFESIGRPLPGRKIIVVSRSAGAAYPDVETAASFDTASERASRLAADMGADEIMIAGGTEIYAQALPLADRLHVTEVDLEPAGDRRFPAIDGELWTEVSRIRPPRAPKDDAGVVFVEYRRRPLSSAGAAIVDPAD